jgi:hypothetical protein
MTQPDQTVPDTAANKGSFASFAAKTQEQWEEEQRGKVSGRLTPAKTGFERIGADISKILDNVVSGFFGWVGSGFSHEDSAQALADQAAATAALSAAVTALQNNQNNQAVGGNAEFIDFSSRADGSSLGADFTQTYSGAGTGVWGVESGRAAWLSVADDPRSCVAVYNADETTTDYQMVGAAFATAPVWFNSGAQARNYLFGRMNSAGTSYVYADFGKRDVELGCVVAGVKTVFETESSFSFKANALYWLRCGTVGGLRIFQILEGTTPIITHTEVGTTSQAGASYRYSGMGVKAYATGFGTSPPGKVSAWAFSDNQPPTLVGSYIEIWRAATGTVTMNAGVDVLPNNFFDNLGPNTAEYGVSLTTGTITVGMAGQFRCAIRAKVGIAFVTQFSWMLYVNGSPIKHVGDPHIRGVNALGGNETPEGCAGEIVIPLEAGDQIQFGYDSIGSAVGVLTGEATASETYMHVSLENRSLA